jgi:catechol 2,3-dioxygenase-like lactoylglutathione lyase family enzyme
MMLSASVSQQSISPESKKVNLNQLTIPSSDLVASSAFYQKLGLTLIVDSIPRYARFECPNGESTFSLHESKDVNSDSGIWIYFELENLDQKVQELISDGFGFDELPNDKEWGWRESRLKDPDGHQLILYYAGDNRKNPPWRVEM